MMILNDLIIRQRSVSENRRVVPHNKDTLVGVFVLFDKIYHYIYNIREVLLKTVGRLLSNLGVQAQSI